MSTPVTLPDSTAGSSKGWPAGQHDWNALADQVLAGTPLEREQAVALLQAPDHQLLEILAAAYRVRYRYFGNTVQLYFLVNAKSGLCPEDCHYCSQSKVSDAAIARYRMLSFDELLEGAQQAHDRQARTYCIVISGRAPSEKELAAVERVVPEIKQRFGLKVCACLGLLDAEQARRLKACGVDRVNHNLNTSQRHYGDICTTHSWHDRWETLNNVRAAGIELCSGGIIGLGEQVDDVVELAMSVRELGVESIPLNFLIAIDGTPLAARDDLNPRFCLKALAMFRLMNPDKELRIAGGREVHLRSLQPLGLYPANSIFVGDYLTTEGQLPEEDYRMIQDMGLTITR
jgi:biotin synthase